jgi:hypothetical protein
MHYLSEGLHNNNFNFEEHRVASLSPKSMSSRITKMLEKSSKVKEGSSSEPKYMLMKFLQDFEDLERFYSDKDYRNNLIPQARYPSLEYVQLQNIYEQVVS